MHDLSMRIQSLLGNMPDIAVVIIAAILIINAMMWFFLPFAIYGIKAKMNESRKIQEKILKVMMEIE